jgi:HPt (histidine-containing phosphotransfer) domain-containing protein
MSEHSSYLDKEGALERLGGDEDFLKTMFGIYLEDLPRKLDDLRTYDAEKDLYILGRIAHSLKGASMTVGAMAASEKAREMEEAAKAEDLDRVRRTMSSLFDILDKTTGEMEREVM